MTSHLFFTFFFLFAFAAVKTISAYHCIDVVTRIVLVSRIGFIFPRLRLGQFGDQANVKVRLKENDWRDRAKYAPANR